MVHEKFWSSGWENGDAADRGVVGVVGVKRGSG